MWQLILIGGSVLGAAGFVLAAVTHLSLADGGDHHLSSAAMVALNALDADNYLAFVAGLGVMLVGAAGAIIPRTGGVRWFGWTALVLGIGMFTPVGFFALLLTALWIIVVSVLRFTKPMLFQTPATQPV